MVDVVLLPVDLLDQLQLLLLRAQLPELAALFPKYVRLILPKPLYQRVQQLVLVEYRGSAVKILGQFAELALQLGYEKHQVLLSLAEF